MANPNASFNSQANPGMMLPTTNVWDVSQIYQIEDLSSEMRDLLVRLYQNINNISLAVNIKNTGYYPLQEFLTGQAFFPDPVNNSSTASSPVLRQTFRMTVNFGALPDTGSKSVPHGININAGYSLVSYVGGATSPAPWRSIVLPYPSVVLANTIEVSVDSTYVTVTTAADYSAYTRCIIYIEYLKS